MIEVPFASFYRAFDGKTAWVVGRGPTHFGYEDLAHVDGPVFFINDSVSEEKWLPPGHPSFFFAHDRQMRGWLERPGLQSTPVLITDLPVTGPEGDRRPGLLSGRDDPLLGSVSRAILYRGMGPLFPPMILNRTREEIRDSQQLYLANGTIHPLLHFAWYAGCAKIKFIGCDGLPGLGYDPRLENRSQTQQKNALFIRRRQEALLRRLSLPSEYLGTPPCRIKMIYELSTPAGGEDELQPWVETLVAHFRIGGCAAIALKGRLAEGESLWLAGVWPTLEGCVACLSSDDMLKLQIEGEALEKRLGCKVKFAFMAEPVDASSGH